MPMLLIRIFATIVAWCVGIIVIRWIIIGLLIVCLVTGIIK